MNLEQVREGSAVTVVELKGEDSILRKVQAMGIRKGRRLEVVQKLGRTILLKLNHSKLVITKDIAKHIEVM